MPYVQKHLLRGDGQGDVSEVTSGDRGLLVRRSPLWKNDREIPPPQRV